MAKSTKAERDAILEAADWKHTAAAWRRRALRNAGAWKQKALKLRAERDALEEERDELLEEIEPLREHAKVAVTPAELIDLRRKTKIAEEAADEARRQKSFAERILKDANAQKVKADQNAERFRNDAASAREALGKEREKITREIVQPIQASLRVIAARVGIDHKWLNGEGYTPRAKTHDEILAEIDKRILALQNKANGN